MVAAFRQLHHSPTIITPLPPILLPQLNNPLRRLVVIALPDTMPLTPTLLTHLRLALLARAPLPPRRAINLDILWFYPLPAPFRGAIESVLRRVFGELAVPEDLEFGVEEVLDVAEGDAVLGAAFGRHELWVCR